VAVAYGEIVMINISLQFICFMMSEAGGMVVDGKVLCQTMCSE